MNWENIEREFQKRWWYDSSNLRLCSKDIPVYNEDDELVGYNQNGAAVPNDILDFIQSTLTTALEERTKEILERIPDASLTFTDLEYIKKELKDKYGIK